MTFTIDPSQLLAGAQRAKQRASDFRTFGSGPRYDASQIWGSRAASAPDTTRTYGATNTGPQGVVTSNYVAPQPTGAAIDQAIIDQGQASTMGLLGASGNIINQFGSLSNFSDRAATYGRSLYEQGALDEEQIRRAGITGNAAATIGGINLVGQATSGLLNVGAQQGWWGPSSGIGAPSIASASGGFTPFSAGNPVVFSSGFNA